jgi:hypothetical protein
VLLHISYGAQIATRFDEAKRLDTTGAGAIYDHLAKAASPQQVINTNLVQVCDVSPQSQAGAPAETNASASPPGTGQPAPATAPPAQTARNNGELRLLCDDYAYRHAVFCIIISDIGEFSTSMFFQSVRWLLPIHTVRESQCDSVRVMVGHQEDAQSVAAVLATLSNYWLPVLFGCIGALTALIRDVQFKVSESLLSPRDKALAFIRLPLGLVAGVAVGLFFDPGSLSEDATSIGSFTLTASGVGFLAGYGADAFFRALDALIQKLFPSFAPAK